MEAADVTSETDEVSDDDAEDDTNVFYIEKNGVIEIVTSGDEPKEEAGAVEVGEAQKPDSQDLIGMETDESLGLTREFNFGRELENLAGSRAEDSKPVRTKRTESKEEFRIPDPEEAAVKIVSEAAGTHEIPADDNASVYENVAELSERLFAGMTEISEGGFINVVRKTDEEPTKGYGQSAESTAASRETANAAERENCSHISPQFRESGSRYHWQLRTSIIIRVTAHQNRAMSLLSDEEDPEKRNSLTAWSSRSVRISISRLSSRPKSLRATSTKKTPQLSSRRWREVFSSLREPVNWRRTRSIS